MTALRCYAHRRGQQWHAICLDLDVAVDGQSFPAVVASLQTCIDLYLERVAELPAQERRCFLTRRAPWRVRASSAISIRLHRLNLEGARERNARSFLL